MQYGTTAIELGGFALIARSFGQVVEGLLAGDFQPDCFKSRIHELAISVTINRCSGFCFLLLRGALSLSTFTRLAVISFRTRSSSLEPANYSLRTMRRCNSRANHFGKQVYIVVGFARHLFSKYVKHF